MTEERDDQEGIDRTGRAEQDDSGQQDAQQSGATRERMADQGNEGSFGGQSAGRESAGLGAGPGQSIGGDDSNSGSGTTLSQGADFNKESSNENSRMESQSGGASGEGFIGSKAEGSSDFPNEDRKDQSSTQSDGK